MFCFTATILNYGNLPLLGMVGGCARSSTLCSMEDIVNMIMIFDQKFRSSMDEKHHKKNYLTDKIARVGSRRWTILSYNKIHFLELYNIENLLFQG